MKQHTIKRTYNFSGKGLHTGLHVNMTLTPAPDNYGIKFQRTDIGDNAIIDADIKNVTSTARSTTLENGEIKVITIEHILSAMTGLGIDNVLVKMDNCEAPILDGSSKPYTDAILQDGILEQNEERKYIRLKNSVHYKDEKSGSEITVIPSDTFEIDLTIDYNSKVLGIQTAYYNEQTDYAKEIAPCRTFCFFHELEYLFKNNLIRGGDMENAIVIVENPVNQEVLNKMESIFNVSNLEVSQSGYLNNLQLHFKNECARHKLLDIIGDFTLIGAPLKAKIIANKSGHHINTIVAQMVAGQSTKI